MTRSASASESLPLRLNDRKEQSQSPFDPFRTSDYLRRWGQLSLGRLKKLRQVALRE